MSGRAGNSWIELRWVRVAIPLLIGVAAVGGWEAYVRQHETLQYVLPTPSTIAKTLAADWRSLGAAWLVTLGTMAAALAAAVVGGVLLAMLFAASRILEVSLFPYAVVLQVTPLVAIAPLIVVWLDERVFLSLLLCAWIVAFFPILSNTVIGLKSADRNLRDLMSLYRASPWQRLRHLLIPSALPYFFAGLKVAANLALVGAVVAEFAVGPGGDQTGLASIILSSGFESNFPRMFASLALISLTGIVIYFATHALSQAVLGSWHETALKGER